MIRCINNKNNKKNFELVNLLVEYGADVTKRDSSGKTALVCGRMIVRCI